MHPRAAALIWGNQEHYLDHLGPLAAILNIPLITNHPHIAKLAKHYYPLLKTIILSDLELPPFITNNFDIIFNCLPAPLFKQLIWLYNKQPLSIWIPHGHSDKGANSAYFTGLKEEDYIFTYGKKMGAMIEKNAINTHHFFGNYRSHFYQENSSFYTSLSQLEIPLPKNPTILYAPTWQDDQQSSSCSQIAKHLISTLPNDINLIIKPHPHLFKQTLELLDDLDTLCSEKDNAIFLKSFPPIYALIDNIDIYLGDMSSVGYDCLYAGKQLFILKKHPIPHPIDSCSKILSPDQIIDFYSLVKSALQNSSPSIKRRQEELRDLIFQPKKNCTEIREEIITKINSSIWKKQSALQ